MSKYGNPWRIIMHWAASRENLPNDACRCLTRLKNWVSKESVPVPINIWAQGRNPSNWVNFPFRPPQDLKWNSPQAWWGSQSPIFLLLWRFVKSFRKVSAWCSSYRFFIWRSGKQFMMFIDRKDEKSVQMIWIIELACRLIHFALWHFR